MKHPNRGAMLGLLLVAGMLLMLPSQGCSPLTQLETTWKDPSAPPLAFKRVVVVVLNSTPGERRAQEDVLVSQIKKADAVASYTLVSDSELADQQQVKQKIRQGGFDGAVVLRLVDAQKQTTYIPGTTSYWDGSAGYAPYRSPGYYTTDTIVRAEVTLYAVPEGKLLWSGSSTTANPADAKEFALQVARAAGEELRKQGLLQ